MSCVAAYFVSFEAPFENRLWSFSKMWYHSLKLLLSISIGSLSFVALPSVVLFAQPTVAQTKPLAPTARYARGEEVDLAEIVAEWRGYYEDVPVYQCVCLDGTCSQSEQWPYREFDRYQLSVALGPTNAGVTERAGFNCFDIADGSRPSRPRAFSAALRTAEPGTIPLPPSQATSTPNRPSVSRPTTEGPSVARPDSPTVSAPVSRPMTSDFQSAATSASTGGVPTVTVINDGDDIRLDWPSGSSNVVNVAGSSWNINILNALDCESLSVVDQKMMMAQRVQGFPVVEERTGNVAVPVLLDSCVDVDQTAVFVLDPAEGGGYALYRTQLPPVLGSLSSGTFTFSNEFSSYAFGTILEMRYWNEALLVRQGAATGAEAISIFRAGRTPAGVYAGCGVVSDGEGAGAICDQ